VIDDRRTLYYIEARMASDSSIVTDNTPFTSASHAVKAGTVHFCDVWGWQVVECRPDGAQEVVYSTIGEEL